MGSSTQLNLILFFLVLGVNNIWACKVLIWQHEHLHLVKCLLTKTLLQHLDLYTVCVYWPAHRFHKLSI